jgi:thymidylate kinase
MGHDGGVADQLPPCTFVVVSGPLPSGKTTVARAVAGGWPVLEVCTNEPVDVAPLAARIRAAAGVAA